ncbi:MAG: phytoene/squalene synthase family protein [Rhizobiaceae bacterium]|nr:phytoene/squalene synthase family protein [Rhizobiaceae bacterium]MCV0409113.1 phytoene/squalene synthase family protein [Rhizobiaceae bacterium]
MTPDERHCLTVVREADRERYLSILFAPEERRGALAALQAFHAETARIRDLVHEPLPGEVRLQWWRDAIAAPPGERTGNPVADALRDAIAAHGLPHAAFDRLLEGRVFDLYDDPMPDLATFEAWCGETASTLIQLAAMVLSPGEAPRFADAAGHAGCARAIADLLVDLPRHRARGQCYIPVDILAAAGADREALLAGEARARPAVNAMIALAREHLARFEAEATDLPRVVRPAFLPLASVGAQLSAVEGSADPLHAPRRLSPLRVQWLTWRRAVWGWKA